MEDQLEQSQQLNTGLTMAKDEYQFFQSSEYNYRPQTKEAGSSTIVHPEQQRYSERDQSTIIVTESDVTRLGKIRKGPSRDGAAGRAAGGAADEAASGTVGGAAGGASDYLPPGSNPPSDQDNNKNNPVISRRQRRIRDLQYAKLIQIVKPKRFKGKQEADFDTWWIMVDGYIQDQPERFPKHEQTIYWIGSLMDRYAAPCQIQWIDGTRSGKHPKCIRGYIQTLKQSFEDKDAMDQAVAKLEKVQYEACIRDMFTQIQMHDDTVMVSSAGLKKIILDWLPPKILDRMHTADLTGELMMN